MLKSYNQPSRETILPLTIAGIGAFTIYGLKLSSTETVIGLSLCLFLGAVLSRTKSTHASSKSIAKKAMIVLSAAFLIMLLFSPSVRSAAITEYYLPPGSAQPYGIAFEPSGGTYNVWFAEFGSSRIGKKTGASWSDNIEFQLNNMKPYDIVVPGEKEVYFTESAGSSIGHISLATANPILTEYMLPAGADPHGMTFNSSRASGSPQQLWFAEYGRYAVGLLDLSTAPHPALTEFFLPDSNARPESVLYLPNSGIWFTEFVGDRIGYLTPTGNLLKEWPLPAGSFPHSLSTDMFGNIWFTESGRNRIARLNPYTNQIAEFLIPSANAQPLGIVVDAKSNVWFGEHGTGNIGKFTPGMNLFVEFSRPGGGVWDMQLGPDNKIWFSDDAAQRLGVINPDVATTSQTVSSISTIIPYSTTVTTLGTSSVTSSTISNPGTTGKIYTTVYPYATDASFSVATTTSTTSYSASETSNIILTSSRAIFTSYVTQSVPTTITLTSYASTTTGTTSVTATAIQNTYQTSTVTSTSTLTSYIGTTTSTETITALTTVTATTVTFSLGGNIGMTKGPISQGSFLLFSGMAVVGTFGGSSGLLGSARNAIRKRRWKTLVVALILVAISLTMVLPSRAAAFTEWNLQYGSTSPYGLTFDDQLPGNLWFAEFSSDKIGRLNPSTSEVREIILQAGSHPWDVAFESARHELWFTESGRNIIGRISNYGTGLQEFSLSDMFTASYSEGPRGLAIQEHVNGTDKPYIWAAEYGASAILKIDPYGDPHDVTRWFLSPSSGPQSIAFSDETGVWFTEYSSGKLGNLNPTTGTIREWKVPGGSSPWDLAIDSQNNVWYSDPGRNMISKLNPYTGNVIEYLIPSAGSRPYGIVIDSRGWIWFAEHGVNKLGRFVPDDGTFTEYSRMTGVSTWGVTLQPGSNTLWFGDDSSNRLGRFDSSVAIATTTTNQISTASTSTWSLGLSPTIIITPAPSYASTQYSDGSTTVSYATTTSTTSYQVTEVQKVLLTTTTGTTTLYGSATLVVLGTSTSYSPTTVATQTSTSTITLSETRGTSITAYATSTSTSRITTTSTTTNVLTTGISGVGIPGFPIESILAGIGLGAVFLIVLSRRKHAKK